ncbi:hypothetical protein D3C80_1774880 [compost metagenome]
MELIHIKYSLIDDAMNQYYWHINGRVLNVSGGTAVMNDLEGYLNVPKRWA